MSGAPRSRRAGTIVADVVRASGGTAAVEAQREEAARASGGAAEVAAAVREEAARARGGALLLEGWRRPDEASGATLPPIALLPPHVSIPQRAALPPLAAQLLRATLAEYLLPENCVPECAARREACSHPESRSSQSRWDLDAHSEPVAQPEARSEPRRSEDQCWSRIRLCMCAALTSEELLTASNFGGGGGGGGGGVGGLCSAGSRCTEYLRWCSGCWTPATWAR